MKVCLDLDDFSVVNNRLDLLCKIKAKIPQFKVSMFTIPTDTKTDVGPYLIRKELLERVKENLDWIEIIPHGFLHHGSEMQRMHYNEFAFKLLEIEAAFEKDGLPFVKGFKAPHWRWNEDVVRALDDRGWWGGIDPRQPGMPSPKRFYRYSDPIDNIDYTKDILKLHGHIYGTRNDLGTCYNNLFKLPSDATWHFASEFVEEKV